MRRATLAALLLILSVLPCLAQTSYTSYTLFGSDGNAYGASGNDFYSYSPSSGLVTTLNAADSGLLLCLERSDGTLLGINSPTANSTEFVKVSFAGQITPIVELPSYSTPACPAIASDGNYYGSSSTGGEYGDGFLFQLTAAGALNIVYNFAGTTDGYGPETTPQEGSDGDLYFFNNDGSLLRYSSSLGVSVFSLSYPIYTNLQEGPGGDFYGLDDSADLVKVTPTGAASVIYTAPAADDGVETPGLGPMFVLSDQVAAVVEYDYTNYDPYFGCTASGNYLQLEYWSPTDGDEGLYPLLGTDEYAYQDGGGEADADEYTYGLLAGGNALYGTYTDYNQVEGIYYNMYDEAECQEYTSNDGPLTINQGYIGTPIQMSFSKTHVLPGESDTLTWDVGNAYSLTMQQCYGFFGGTPVKIPVSGSSTITAPSQAGSSTYAIVCGGTETGLTTLNAGNAALSLAASSTHVVIGNPVTLSAKVTNAATPAPTGTVKFLDGSTVIGTATLANGAAAFTASTAGLPTGTYNITASYAGDANYGPATSSAVSVTLLARSPTTLSLSPATQTVLQGNTVSITATVAGNSTFSYPTGPVTFSYGKTVLGTFTLSRATALTSSANFSAATTGVAAGSYAITAAYAGDADHVGSVSASPSTVVVTVPASTTVTLAASPNPVPANTSFTLTATPHGRGTPTGMVTFYVDGSNQLTSVTLNSSGVASVTIPAGTLAPGTYGLTAYYAGDSNNLSSTSPVLSLTVQ